MTPWTCRPHGGCQLRRGARDAWGARYLKGAGGHPVFLPRLPLGHDCVKTAISTAGDEPSETITTTSNTPTTMSTSLKKNNASTTTSPVSEERVESPRRTTPLRLPLLVSLFLSFVFGVVGLALGECIYAMPV